MLVALRSEILLSACLFGRARLPSDQLPSAFTHQGMTRTPRGSYALAVRCMVGAGNTSSALLGVESIAQAVAQNIE
jgi:hypothetical protein